MDKPMAKRVTTCTFLLLITVLISIKYFFSSNLSFQLDSDRFVTGMLAAGILDADVSSTPFGLNVFNADEVTMDGTGMGDEKNDTVYFLYHTQDYQDSNIQIRGTRMQQIGVQGWFAYWFGQVCGNLSISGRISYYLLRAINAFLLSLVLIVISLEIKKAYNWLFALSFLAVSAYSGMLTDFAPSLYWVTFTWYLPMLLGLICLNHLDKRWFIYPLILLAVALKSACGYEYITTVMLGAIVFLCVELCCAIGHDKDKTKLLFKTIIGVGISCLAGFALVFFLNAFLRGNGNIFSGMRELFLNDILRRTFGDAADYDAVYADSLNASIFTVIKKYLLTTGVGLFALGLTAVSFALIVCRRRINTGRDVILLFMSFFTSMSWFVLGKSHSYIHTHINPVLFYLPYIQTAVYIVLKHGLSMLFSKYSAQQLADAIEKGIDL